MTKHWLSASLPVLDLAVMSIEEVRSAAIRAGASGSIVTAPADPERIAGSFASDRLLSVMGERPEGFAPLSGFFKTADGWVRTHGNYPHHARRLAELLGLDEADRSAVAGAIAERCAAEIEDAAAAVGAIAVRVRTEHEWRASEPARALTGVPLVATHTRTDERTRRLSLIGGPSPLAGVRVLDLTRVIAGPVATRTLALLGADVLRIDPPSLAEVEWQHLDTGQGKRSALLDLRRDLVRGQELLDAADVLVTGYRPGSIESLGLRLPPGIVHARINAWGDQGPWVSRRGFDSIVQAACGIAMLESRDGTTPGVLPAQALDHSSGYLLASGVIRALVDVTGDGLGREIAVSLARTAQWLLDAEPRVHDPEPAPTPTCTVSHGGVVTAAPALPGYADYPAPAREWGSDDPSWS